MKAGRIERFFTKMSISLENNYILNEVVQSFVALIPIFMIGALTLVLQYFPIPAVAEFIENAFDGLLYDGLGFVYDATYGVIGIYIVVLLSFRYSMTFTRNFSSINIMAVVTSVASYFVLIGGKSFQNIQHESVHVFLRECTNERNVFVAAMVAIVSTYCTMKMYRVINRKNSFVDINIDYTRRIKGIIPMASTVSLFLIIAMMIRMFTPYEHFGDAIT